MKKMFLLLFYFGSLQGADLLQIVPGENYQVSKEIQDTWLEGNKKEKEMIATLLDERRIPIGQVVIFSLLFGLLFFLLKNKIAIIAYINKRLRPPHSLEEKLLKKMVFSEDVKIAYLQLVDRVKEYTQYQLQKDLGHLTLLQLAELVKDDSWASSLFKKAYNVKYSKEDVSSTEFQNALKVFKEKLQAAIKNKRL